MDMGHSGRVVLKAHLWESVLQPLGLRALVHVTRLGSKFPYPTSHLSDPLALFLMPLASGFSKGKAPHFTLRPSLPPSSLHWPWLLGNADEGVAASSLNPTSPVGSRQVRSHFPSLQLSSPRSTTLLLSVRLKSVKYSTWHS